MAQWHTDQCFGVEVCKVNRDGVLDCTLCTCGHSRCDHVCPPEKRHPEGCSGSDGLCKCGMFERDFG